MDGHTGARSRRTGLGVAAATVGVLLLAGCAAATSATTPTTPAPSTMTPTPTPTTSPADGEWSAPSPVTGTALRLAVSFDGDSPQSWLLASGGSWATDVVTSGAGAVTRAAGQEPPTWAGLPATTDEGSAALPAYKKSGADFAALTVTPTDEKSTALLAPGRREFALSVDVRLDPSTPLTKGRAEDNGNNVLQRGLAGSDQMKIQVDAHDGQLVPTCVLRDGGIDTAEVLGAALAADAWYRVTCTRTVDGLAEVVYLVVEPLAGGAPAVTGFRGSSVTNLDFREATPKKPIPLSVGAKVKATGELFEGASDQFNGDIDNVVLAID